VVGGRQHSHRVLVTPEEEARLAQLAEAQRVSVPRLLVESALSGSGETPTQRREAMAELFAVRRLLAAVSNNVNQVARHANAGQEFPPDAAGVLVGVRRVVGRIDATYHRGVRGRAGRDRAGRGGQRWRRKFEYPQAGGRCQRRGKGLPSSRAKA
jgi:hypothetical protein